MNALVFSIVVDLAGQIHRSFCCFVTEWLMSCAMRKPAFRTCENKGADQLCGYRAADQRFYFRYLDSTIPLLRKSKISGLLPSSAAVQLGLCRNLSETRRPVLS